VGANALYCVFSGFYRLHQILRLGAEPTGDDLMTSGILLMAVVAALTAYLTAVILFPEKF
jgi:K+-transporting ATPase KdpF subunit